MSRPFTLTTENSGVPSSAVDPVLFELPPERGAADPERFGGARVVASEALQGLQDVHALGLGECRLPRELRRGAELQGRRYVRRQVRRLEDVAASQDGRALDRVLQLAHVARPRTAEQPPHRLGGEPQLATQLAAGTRQEMLGQRRTVFPPIARRRQVLLDDV